MNSVFPRQWASPRPSRQQFPISCALDHPAASCLASTAGRRTGNENGLARPSAALGVKGGDFHARHKLAKALDFLTSGVPLMMQVNGSGAEHLRSVSDFLVADLGEWNCWLLAEYWRDVQRLDPQLRSDLSLEQIARRFLSPVS